MAAEKIPGLTAMRGIAALGVVLFHVDVAFYHRQLGSLVPTELAGVIKHGYLWVDFFFLLSGFIITHVYGDELGRKADSGRYGRYLWARFSRIYPLHLFTLSVLIVVVPISSAFAVSLVDESWRRFFVWSAVPSHLLLVHAMGAHDHLTWNAPSWSIGAEWWTYVCAIPLIALIHGKRTSVTFLAAAIASILLTALVLGQGARDLDLTYDYGFVRCLFEFTIGICLYQWYRRGIFRVVAARDETFLVGCVLLGVCLQLSRQDLWTIPLFSLLILCGARNQGGVRRLLSTRPLQFLGDVSYSVYLVHSLWYLALWFTLPHLDFLFHLSKTQLYLTKWGVLAAFVALTLATSAVTYRWVEVRQRRFLRSIFPT